MIDKVRCQEFLIIKTLIEQCCNQASGGLFDCHNVLGDNMINLYHGECFTLDICCDYGYFEVFGTTKCEFDDLQRLYEKTLNKHCSIYNDCKLS